MSQHLPLPPIEVQTAILEWLRSSGISAAGAGELLGGFLSGLINTPDPNGEEKPPEEEALTLRVTVPVSMRVREEPKPLDLSKAQKRSLRQAGLKPAIVRRAAGFRNLMDFRRVRNQFRG